MRLAFSLAGEAPPPPCPLVSLKSCPQPAEPAAPPGIQPPQPTLHSRCQRRPFLVLWLDLISFLYSLNSERSWNLKGGVWLVPEYKIEAALWENNRKDARREAKESEPGGEGGSRAAGVIGLGSEGSRRMTGGVMMQRRQPEKLPPSHGPSAFEKWLHCFSGDCVRKPVRFVARGREEPRSGA